eukprot:TRINITY_DN8095_c0_g1_i1.p3 TRINITY_DN8095_c0_g1~~TRINITY_DN8095_c0_g1_i1.p3  ORF type:complete len:102 (+),score=30.75 TRINITY_DN8095_c0_g1_i1:314-619(+)
MMPPRQAPARRKQYLWYLTAKTPTMRPMRAAAPRMIQTTQAFSIVMLEAANCYTRLNTMKPTMKAAIRNSTTLKILKPKKAMMRPEIMKAMAKGMGYLPKK